MFQEDFLGFIKEGYRLAQSLLRTFFSYPWADEVIYILAGLIVLRIIYLLVRRYYREKTRTSAAFQKVILLITVPKEVPGEEGKVKPLKEMLSPMEVFYDNIGGLEAERGFMANFRGTQDHFIFEVIADKEGKISFYLVVPRYRQQFIEQQIHAQIPDAQIEEVEDYNIFGPKGVILTARLKLYRHWIFPIRTYLSAEVDHLTALTNSLSKITPGDAVAIQIVARSAKGEWHKFGAKVASEMQQGKKLSEAMGVLGKNIFSSFFKILGEAFKTTPKPEPGQIQKPSYQLSPMEQQIVKALEEKTSKAGLDVNIRIIASAKDYQTAKSYLDNITNSFAQYAKYEYGNGFRIIRVGSSKKEIRNFIYRHFDEKNSFILNTEEMTSLYHLPLPTTETPNIRWLLAKFAPAPVGVPEEGIILGENSYRGITKLIRITEDDRRRHIYVIGKTGTGKSVLLSNLAIQDIKNGHGVCVLDPHGELVETILENIPKERIEDVIYFNPADTQRPLGLNLLTFDPKYPEQKTFAINEMINIMDKLYDLKQTGGPMFEQYVRNAMLLIMDHPESGSTLMEISKVMADPDFRHFKLDHCKNPVVRDFWIKEAEKAGGDWALSNMTPYITSKLNQFVANDTMRPIIAQQESAFNLREVMDKSQILLINLAKGRIGDLNAYLLGLVLVGKILMAALSRTDIPQEERKDFYLYIDEFQNFITESISTILAEARKYRLNLIIAHQYMGQLIKGQDTSIRDAILGTVGTMITFKIGIEDAEILAKEFAPVFNQYDLINIQKYNAYLKLLVSNESLRPFNVKTLPPTKGDPEIAKKIKEFSRLKYGREKDLVEREILERVKKVSKKVVEEEEEE